MIEIGFAIILGFAVTSTLSGLLADGSRGDMMTIRTLVYLAALATLIALYQGEAARLDRVVVFLAVSSVATHLFWFVLGSTAALLAQLLVEGVAKSLWIRLHPQSVPTPEAKMGQRCQNSTGQKKAVPAALVGVSTEYLTSDLDLRTETLIRLSYFAFEDRGALMMSRLESSLRLGTGRRQRAFYKLAAGMRGRPKLKPTVHRYWRSVNGSSRMGQSLFADLCSLASDTGNQDRATLKRLSDVGVALGLNADEMQRALRSGH